MWSVQIRDQNLQDIKTAGPQSQVLTGSVMDRSFTQVSVQSSVSHSPCVVPLSLTAYASSQWVMFNCDVIF